MMPGSLIKAKAAFVLIAAVLFSPTVAAQNVFVRLLVNDTPITNYDINARAKLLQLSRMSAARARKQAEDELINEVLQLNEARRLNVVVADTQVDQAYATIAQRTKMKPAQFTRALRSVGVDARTLKRRLRASIAWGQVVQTRFRATVRIQEQDVVAAMLKKDDGSSKDKKTTEYTLQQIIFVYPKSASNAVKSQRRREAESLRARFTSCSNSLELAKSLRDVAVKDVGRKSSSELPPTITQMLDETPNGKLTKPNPTSQGIEMLAVCNKREISSIAGAQNEVENELRTEEGLLLARRYIRDLRSDAVIVRKNAK